MLNSYQKSSSKRQFESEDIFVQDRSIMIMYSDCYEPYTQKIINSVNLPQE